LLWQTVAWREGRSTRAAELGPWIRFLSECPDVVSESTQGDYEQQASVLRADPTCEEEPVSREAIAGKRWLQWLIPFVFGSLARAGLAADACAEFRWDVSRERALFATMAEAVTTGKDVVSAPWVVPDRLYELAVAPQDQVTFEASPGKKGRVEGASAGLLRLHLSTAGEYRISIDQGFWIDVVAEQHIVAAEDFQGRPGCRAPHKIVLYSLPGGKDLTLQLSGAVGSQLRLTITPLPVAQTPQQ
jgi:hypothetical protein